MTIFLNLLFNRTNFCIYIPPNLQLLPLHPMSNLGWTSIATALIMGKLLPSRSLMHLSCFHFISFYQKKLLKSNPRSFSSEIFKTLSRIIWTSFQYSYKFCFCCFSTSLWFYQSWAPFPKSTQRKFAGCTGMFY